MNIGGYKKLCALEVVALHIRHGLSVCVGDSYRNIGPVSIHIALIILG